MNGRDLSSLRYASPRSVLTQVKRSPMVASMTEQAARERLARWGMTSKQTRWLLESSEWMPSGTYIRWGIRVDSRCTFDTADYRVTRRYGARRAPRRTNRARAGTK